MNYRKYHMSDLTYVTRRFKRVMGYDLDLNNPKTLNEKINWLKINDHSALHTQCADKLAVRDYVERKIGTRYLVPLFLSTQNPEEIVPENLPEVPHIIKTNHDSGGGEIVFDKDKTDFGKIRRQLKKRMSENYYHYSKEKQYRDIIPSIIVEQLIIDNEGNLPNDYKIHCFNGKPEFIQVDMDRFKNHKRNFYDFEWNLLPFSWSAWKNGQPRWPNGPEVKNPGPLTEMYELASKLSEDFYYARVDFYISDGKIFFGEITFHHGGGTEKFSPDSWDLYYGNMLEIPAGEK